MYISERGEELLAKKSPIAQILHFLFKLQTIPMEKKSSRLSTPTFYLKVNLQCCQACPKKARKKLQKLDGVFAFSVDTETGLVSVSGPVDPQVVVRNFAKWGKKALPWSPPKSGTSPTQFSTTKMDRECYSDDHDSPFDSDSDDDHDENCYERGGSSARIPNNISWHHSDLQEKPVATISTPQKVKRPSLFARMFGKNNGGTKPQGCPSSGPRRFMNPGPNGFGQRRPMMPQYGAPGPNYPPHWGRPPQYGMAGMPQYPYYQARYPLPPPPSGGIFQSRPPPSQYNPMTHYTRYEDNYRWS